MKVLTNNQYYSEIANVIREQNGTNNTYTPPQMVSALKDLFYEEVEGVPPITYNGIGENLLDYRIDGASGGVGERTNNLFDKTKTNRKLNQAKNADGTMNYSTVSSNFFDYYIAVEPNTQYTVTDERNAPSRIYFFKSDKTWIDRSDLAPGDAYPKKRVFTTPSNCYYIQFQESKDRMMNENTLMLNVGNISLPYESYYKIPVIVEGKNLLQNTATTQTVNGVTFTVNEDKSITCNGTATGTAAITINTIFSINSTKISGCPMGGSWSSFELDLLNINTNNVDVIDTGNGAVIQNENSYRVRIRIASGYTCNNLTFYPMIRKADIEDDTYEPYIEPTTINIYLDKPIEAKANIPSEYTEVEYLESTGTQYINTGFKLNTNCRIVFDYYLTDLVSFSPFGSYQTQNQIGFTAYTTDNTSRFGTFVTRRMTGNYNKYQINNRTHFEYSKNGLYQNGSLVYSITTNDAVSNYNCFIFARNVDDVATGFGNIRMYYFKIYDNDSLVRNLIPCYRKSDNVAGLYDLVNSTFYTNEGTGNFIVGPIKENESISLSDTNTNIPTIRGTNVLTVDTTVQPSNVYVKSRKESQYEIALRQYYESIINS